MKLRSIESLRFFGFSLDTLASSLKPENSIILRKEFPQLDEAEMKLVMRKDFSLWLFERNEEKMKQICQLGSIYKIN